MIKSQFNIKISKDLLTRVKRQAMMAGKSLTEHITDLVTKSLSDDFIQSNEFNSVNQMKNFEDRLLTLESIVSNREYLSEKFKPFTNSEAINCTEFMRGFFDQEVEKRNINEKKKAFNDLLSNVNTYVHLNRIFSDRFEEILLSDNPTPWTGKELNDLTKNDKCNCPIRKGLINWTGKTDCPSQQEICDKGKKLLILL
tara:strand:+ start:348 stop:941 length:594 start_codon:yes stop_codon:yes gene_type:complete